MSKTTKKIMAFLTAMTMTAGAVGVTAYAMESNESSWLSALQRQYERQGNEMHQAYYKIDEFLCKGGLVYSIDAESYMNGWGDEPGDNIVVEYINDEAKKAVEDFIEKNKINREWLDIHEMPYSEKCLVISINKVNQFICQNDLSCRIEPINGADEYTEGLNITYYALYEDDKKAVEQYITERGYDKIMPVKYTMIGDPDPSLLITDADEIKTIIEELAAEHGIKVEVNVFDSENHTYKWMGICAGDENKSRKDNTRDVNVIVDLMDNNNLDRSKVRIYPCESNIEEYDETDTEYAAEGGNNGKIKSINNNERKILGDANEDGKTNVRDCACIANALANGEAESLPDNADYNQDTRKNVRDAAAISNDLANK